MEYPRAFHELNPALVTSAFFNTRRLLPKDVSFEEAAPNLLIAPSVI